MRCPHNEDDPTTIYPTLPATIINIPKKMKKTKTSKQNKSSKSSREPSLHEMNDFSMQSDHDVLMRQPTVIDIKTVEDEEILPALPATIIIESNFRNFQTNKLSSEDELFNESSKYEYNLPSDLLLSPIEKENSSRIDDIPVYESMIKESTNIDMKEDVVDADKDILTVSILPLNTTD